MFFAKVIADQLRFLGSSKGGALNQFGWNSVKSAVYHHEAQLKCRAAESQLPPSTGTKSSRLVFKQCPTVNSPVVRGTCFN